MSGSNNNTNNNEVYKSRPHYIEYESAFILLLFGVAIKFFIDFFVNMNGARLIFNGINIGYWFPAVIGLLAIFDIIKTTIQIIFTTYYVDIDIVSVKKGVLRQQVRENLMTKVEDISVDQSILGRLLHYGDVTIIGTGGSTIVFENASYPYKVKELIEKYTKSSNKGNNN